MRSTKLYRDWTHPELEMPEAYSRLSYALFLTDYQGGEIVASRCPDPDRLAVGHALPGSLGLTEETLRFLYEETSDARPMFVLTDVGVGLLDKRYDRHAGVTLFLHIHGRPHSLARLINHGVLGEQAHEPFRVSQAIRSLGSRVTARDESSFRALVNARSVLLRPAGTAYLRVDDRRNGSGGNIIYRADLCDAIQEMAAFAGCEVRFDEENTATRLRCYRPMVLEAILLCAVTQAAMISAGGTIACRVSTLNGEAEGAVALSLHYAVKPPLHHELSERIQAVNRHLAEICEIHGLDFHSELHVPTKSEQRTGRCPEVCMTLEWLYDPTLLPTSDLKTDPGLRL